MKNFADKNALFNIIMDVRGGIISSHQGLKQIFKLLLSLHGSIGVVSGEIIYSPDKERYLDYIERSSSIIGSDGDKQSSLSRSMRLALLEEAMEWEISVGEQICSLVNDSLANFSVKSRMYLLDQYINGLTVIEISKKNNVHRSTIYEHTKKIRIRLENRFNLVDREDEELKLKFIKKCIDESVDSPIKKTCQVNIENSLKKILWEKSL